MGLNTDIVFLSGKRTAFGTFNGVFAGKSATELGTAASKAAILQAGVNPGDIDHVIFGNVMQTSPDAIYCARHIGLQCEIPAEVPAVTVNRLCGSGFESLVQAAHRLALGEATVVLAGGTENMSQAPHTIRGARAGFKLGGTPMNDYLQEVLHDPQAGCSMAITAENLGEKYGISREEADEYGYRSQTAWKDAYEAGRYAEEIIPVTLTSRRGDRVIDVDEHPQLSPLAPEKFRSRFGLESMKRLRAIFKKDGTVTAANASGINDGAATVLLASGTELAEHKLESRARIVGATAVGCDPVRFGLGPVGAVQSLCKQTGWDLSKVDTVEMNEAFAIQVVACARELELSDEQLNPCGGAIALGHPIGASGTRILVTLLHNLEDTDGKRGIATLCVGGGMGIAMAIERD